MKEINNMYWYITRKRLDISQVPEENFDIIFAESGIPEKDPHIDIVAKFTSLEELNKYVGELTNSEYDVIIGREVL